jgi:hypothetical protein
MTAVRKHMMTIGEDFPSSGQGAPAAARMEPSWVVVSPARGVRLRLLRAASGRARAGRIPRTALVRPFGSTVPCTDVRSWVGNHQRPAFIV